MPNLEDDYRELGLKPGASLEQVRSAYRELALLWHPDRRKEGQGRAAAAHHKMTRLNLAYQRLRKTLDRKVDPRPAAQPSARGPAREERGESGAPRARARAQELRTNTLGMRFVSVEGAPVLFSIWPTRVQDYRVYAESAMGVDGMWKKASFAQAASHPVVNVSWEEAAQFCRWLTEREQRDGKLPMGAHFRLPSDAEWSWAVGIGSRERSGTPQEKGKRLKAEYPWGTAWPPPKGVGNYAPSLQTDSFEFTSPVGSFAPNGQGLFDLGGNVWEWCQDFLEGAPRGGELNRAAGLRVLRGASWNFSGPNHLLSSYRNGVAQDSRSEGIGFRPVLALG